MSRPGGAHTHTQAPTHPPRARQTPSRLLSAGTPQLLCRPVALGTLSDAALEPASEQAPPPQLHMPYHWPRQKVALAQQTTLSAVTTDGYVSLSKKKKTTSVFNSLVIFDNDSSQNKFLHFREPRDTPREYSSTQQPLSESLDHAVPEADSVFYPWNFPLCTVISPLSLFLNSSLTCALSSANGRI